MCCNCINCYKYFDDAFCNSVAICNNLSSQDPITKVFDRKTKNWLIKDLA